MAIHRFFIIAPNGRSINRKMVSILELGNPEMLSGMGRGDPTMLPPPSKVGAHHRSGHSGRRTKTSPNAAPVDL